MNKNWKKEKFDFKLVRCVRNNIIFNTLGTCAVINTKKRKGLRMHSHKLQLSFFSAFLLKDI